MTAQVEACMKMAAECDHRARTAGDDKVRATYQQLAQQWRQLAALTEILDRKTSSVASGLMLRTG
jgi:hypothetical protein